MNLTVEDFQSMFGGVLDQGLSALVEKHNWGYKPLSEHDRDAVIISILNRIEDGRFSTAGMHTKAKWERGWQESLDAYSLDGDNASLVPKYIKPSQIVRLGSRFVHVDDPQFELNWYRIFAHWFFKTYLRGFDHIFEFGCGSGHNVAALSTMFPNTRIHGLDWALPSVQIVETMRSEGKNVEGHLFDFYNPNIALTLPPNSAVVTMGALEQTGAKWQPFLEYLIGRAPELCVHAEPILEWYDPNNLVDHTAIQAHFKRNFWVGFPDALKDLHDTGRAQMLEAHRTGFGSELLEGYSQMVWKPL